MRLNRWLALLLAALLCGALTGTLAEADIVPDEAASLEVSPLEDGRTPELAVSDDLELDVDAELGEIESPAPDPAGADAQEAPAGETVANWEPYELLRGETRDEHGEIIETYTYFYDEAGSCYRIIKGKNVRITDLAYDLKYKTENIVIPGKLRKYRVTEIGDYLLSWGSNRIRSVTIPNTVKTVGRYAFQYLRGLKRVTIPKSVTSIGDYAFAGCDYLTSVTIPGSVKTLGNGVFSGCTVLSTVKLNKGLKTIGDSAFYECVKLKKVTLPASVTTVGANAFYDCSSLVSVVFSKNLKTIGDDAFYNCAKLKKATLPNSVTTVGARAFCYCTSLQSIVFSKNLKTIGESAFACSGLKKAILPAKLKTLGKHAFSECNNLTTASVPISVTRMGEGVFYSCEKLKKLTISPKLFKNAWANYVTQVIIPSGVTSIPASAFSDAGITQVTIPATVKTIGESAFSGSGLTAVDIPASVTCIGRSAFGECGSLKKITLKKGLKTIGEEAFYGTGLTSVSIPASVTDIGDYAFSYCRALATLTLNEGLKTIGASAFYNDDSLVTVVIPDSVESIGTYAFASCSSLTSVTIPRKTQLGDWALPGNYDDLTVRTYYNSPAEAYAKAHRLKVEYLDAPTSITLNFTGIVQLEKYQFLELVPVLAPEGCAPYVTWKSSDSFVADVSDEGVVSAYELGRATITVYDANGRAAASVDIEVIPPKPTSVNIYCWGDYIGVGETTTPTVDFEPYDAEAALTWSSSNTGVATVDQDGVVTGVSAGTADITVTTDNGLSATVTITVFDDSDY